MHPSKSNYSNFKALLDMGLRIADLLCIVVAARIAYAMRFHTLSMGNAYIGAQAMVVIAAFAVFGALKLYEQPLEERPVTHFCCVAASWIAIFGLVIALGFMLKIDESYSRAWVTLFFTIGMALLVQTRVVALAILRNMSRRGVGLSNCLLIGATDAGLRILEHSRNDPGLGMNITGYVSTPYDQAGPIDLKQVGTLDNIDAVFDSEAWSQVLIALPVNKAAKAISHMLDCAEDRVITVKFVPDTLGSELINHRIDDFAGTPVMTLRASPLSGYAWIWKAFEDRLIAAMILLLISPVLVVVACGVRFSSPGPILYRQRRIGLDGEEFEMLKFRSMPVNLERGKVQWGGAGSKTTTRFGRFIRQTSLDELPQFINVLKGDMSIVGPRPERTVFVEKFKQEIPGYMHKHLVKAGITGWAQINGWRGDTDLVKRIEYDLYYINHWSLRFDLKIIFLTIFKGFVHSEKGAEKTAAEKEEVSASS